MCLSQNGLFLLHLVGSQARQMCCLESDDNPREIATSVSWRITDCLLMFWRLKSRGFSDEINGLISMTWLVCPMGREKPGSQESPQEQSGSNQEAEPINDQFFGFTFLKGH
jgi:hypothetical protein